MEVQAILDNKDMLRVFNNGAYLKHTDGSITIMAYEDFDYIADQLAEDSHVWFKTVDMNYENCDKIPKDMQFRGIFEAKFAMRVNGVRNY